MVPIYSLVMGVRTLLEAHPPVIWIAVTAVVVGLLAAVIQASGAQLQVTGERDRMIVQGRCCAWRPVLDRLGPDLCLWDRDGNDVW